MAERGSRFVELSVTCAVAFPSFKRGGKTKNKQINGGLNDKNFYLKI